MEFLNNDDDINVNEIEYYIDIDVLPTEKKREELARYNEKIERYKNQNKGNIVYEDEEIKQRFIAASDGVIAQIRDKNYNNTITTSITTLTELKRIKDFASIGMFNFVLIAGTFYIGKNVLPGTIDLIKFLVMYLFKNRDKIITYILNGTINVTHFITIISGFLFMAGYSQDSINTVITKFFKNDREFTEDEIAIMKIELQMQPDLSLYTSLAYLNTCLMYLKKVYVRNINLTIFAEKIMESAIYIFDKTVNFGKSTMNLIEELKTSSRVLLEDGENVSNYSKFSDETIETIETFSSSLTSGINENTSNDILLEKLMEVNEKSEAI
jgi:hypothetical protein